MRDFTAEAHRTIEVYLDDPTPNLEIAARNQILHLAKSGPGDLFALHSDLVEKWGKTPPRWPEEDKLRIQVLAMIAEITKNERLCHMCQLGRFAHVNTVGEGTNMEVRHYRCTNPTCGSWDAERMHPA
jgi:hypothetical protein